MHEARAKGRLTSGSWLRFAMLLAILAALNTTIWSLAIPPGQAPDESAHFSLAKFFADHGRVAEFGVDPGMGVTPATTSAGAQVGYFSYAGQPQLPYVIAGLFVDMPTDSEWMDYRQARAPGALWMALTTMFAFLLGRRLTGSPAIAAAIAAIVALWPQLTFVNAYVNQDAYTVMAGTGLMWSWWRGAQRDWDYDDAALTGLFIGLVVQGKLTGYPLLALSVVVLAATLRGGPRRVTTRVMTLLGTALAFCAWWLATAFDLYGLDVYASGRADQMARELAIVSGSARDNGFSIIEMIFEGDWLITTTRSFVGTFGGMDVPISVWLYLLVGSVVVFGTIGSLMRLASTSWARVRGDAARSWLIGCTLAPIVIMPLMSLLQSWLIDFQPQGRYLFPALVPLVVVIVLGLREFGDTRARRASIVGFGVAAIATANAVAYFDTIQVRYGVSLGDWWGRWQSIIVLAWIVTAIAVLLVGSRLVSRALRAQSTPNTRRTDRASTAATA